MTHLEPASLDEAMQALADNQQMWLNPAMPELAEVTAMLTRESVQRAVELLRLVGFVLAREVADDGSITRMSDEELLAESVKAIRWAARGEAEGGNDVSYAYAMQLLAESNRRLVADGHRKGCTVGVYAKAYEQVTAHHAQRPPIPLTCCCGAGETE